MIYFIKSTNYVKIGFTNKYPLNNRVDLLQVGNPHKLKIIKVISGSINKEKYLHRKFNNFSVRGEWFRLNKEIRAFIKKQKKYIHTPPKPIIEPTPTPPAIPKIDNTPYGGIVIKKKHLNKLIGNNKP